MVDTLHFASQATTWTTTCARPRQQVLSPRSPIPPPVTELLVSRAQLEPGLFLVLLSAEFAHQALIAPIKLSSHKLCALMVTSRLVVTQLVPSAHKDTNALLKAVRLDREQPWLHAQSGIMLRKVQLQVTVWFAQMVTIAPVVSELDALPDSTAQLKIWLACLVQLVIIVHRSLVLH